MFRFPISGTRRGPFACVRNSVIAFFGLWAFTVAFATMGPSDAFAKNCGGNGQRVCFVPFEGGKVCDGGLTIKVNGTCGSAPSRPGHCGHEGQRACKLWEWVPSCAGNLGENPANGGRCENTHGKNPFLFTMEKTKDVVVAALDQKQQCLNAFSNGSKRLPPLPLMDQPALKPMRDAIGESAQCQIDMVAGFVCESPEFLKTVVGMITAPELKIDINGALASIKDDYEAWYTSEECKRISDEVGRSSCAVGMMAVGNTLRETICIGKAINKDNARKLFGNVQLPSFNTPVSCQRVSGSARQCSMPACPRRTNRSRKRLPARSRAS
jgi:hypothetical protein